MSVATTTSLQAFAKLMAKKTAVESTKNLKQSMDSINNNEASGAFDQLSGVMQDMKGAAINSVPFKLMLAQFNAGTMESRIELMNSMLELLGSDVVQAGIIGLIDLMNKIVSFLADVATWTDTELAKLEAQGPGTIAPSNQMTGTGGAVLDPNDSFFTRLSEAIRGAFSPGR